MQRFAIASVLFLAAALTMGCGTSLPATVTGVVTLDGQALPDGETITGTVMFYPVAGGAAAYGEVTSGGNYAMQTGGTNGLEPGDYKVTVRVVEMEPEPPGGYKNAPGQKLLTPRHFEDREKSGIIKTVAAGKNNIELDLTSK